MSGTNNNSNGKTPIKIVQLLIDNVKLEFTNSQEKINKEINELTKVIVMLINKMNGVDKVLIDKLDSIKSKTCKMILVVKVVFAILTIAVLLAVFGSHMLYKYNVSGLVKEAVEKESKENITRSELKDIIKEYIDELNKEKPIKK